jgi:WD40 repeat protein
MHHSGPIAGIAAHGKLVATAGYDNKVILWDAASRKSIARCSHDHLVNHCAFSNDGAYLVTASSDYSARIWTVPDLRLVTVLTGHQDDVDMAAFSADSQRIATCALDRRVRIFSVTGQLIHDMPGHTGNVLSLAWTPDDRHVVTTSVDGTVRTWDAESGKPAGVTALDVRTDSVEIGPDGTVYAGDDRGRLALIRAGEVNYFQAHQAGIKKIALNAEGDRLVSLSYDRSLKVWDLSDAGAPREVQHTLLPEAIWARAATVLPDGRIAAGTFGSTYAVFDPVSGQWDLQGVAAGPAINAVLSVGGKNYAVGDAGCVCVDCVPIAQMGSLCNFLVASGEAVFTGGQMGSLLDALTGAVLYQHHSPLNCAVAFVKNAIPYFAVGTYTGEVLIFSNLAGAAPVLVEVLAVYENAVKGLSCDGGLLFSVCASTDIAWHSVDSFALVKRIKNAHERIANACCSLGDQQFASVSRDRSIRLWTQDGSERYPSPHPNSVKCIEVNASRTHVLTGSYGGTLAAFDIAQRRWLEMSRPSTSGISSIAWDEAQQQFVAASYDGNLYPYSV